MKKLIGLVLLTTALGACTTFQTAFQTDEDALSPSALVATQTARCERDARMATTASPSFPTPGSTRGGDSDTTLDINRSLYWKCARELPTTR